jgi:hypothetical protein
MAKREKKMCDRPEIRFERQRRIGIPGASGQLRCGPNVRLERRQPAFSGYWLDYSICVPLQQFSKLCFYSKA